MCMSIIFKSVGLYRRIHLESYENEAIHMVNQPQEVCPIVKMGVRNFSSTLWALGLISFLERIGREWFLSWVHQLFELYSEQNFYEGAKKGTYFSSFFVNKFGRLVQVGKRRLFTLLSTDFIRWGCYFSLSWKIIQCRQCRGGSDNQSTPITLDGHSDPPEHFIKYIFVARLD